MAAVGAVLATAAAAPAVPADPGAEPDASHVAAVVARHLLDLAHHTAAPLLALVAAGDAASATVSSAAVAGDGGPSPVPPPSPPPPPPPPPRAPAVERLWGAFSAQREPGISMADYLHVRRRVCLFPMVVTFLAQRFLHFANPGVESFLRLGIYADRLRAVRS